MTKRTESVVELGIVGCGALVQECYVGVFRAMPEVRVVAVADLNAENARATGLAFGAEIMEAAAVAKRCHWVLVATPPESHHAVARMALESCPNVIIEKPFTTSLVHAEDLVGLAREKSARLMVAQFRRTFPATRLARQLVESGTIGAVTRLEAFEGGKFAWETKSGYVGKSRFGGVLFDTGSHTIDQALYIAGLESCIAAVEVDRVDRDRPEPSHQIEADFALLLDSGRIGCRLKLSRAQTLANVVRIVGTEGSVECDVGYVGQVRLWKGGRCIRMVAPERMGHFVDAFAAEYREMFSNDGFPAFLASSTRLQMKVLEVLFNYGS